MPGHRVVEVRSPGCGPRRGDGTRADGDDASDPAAIVRVLDADAPRHRIRPRGRDVLVTPGQDVAGWVLKNRRPYLALDPEHDPVVSPAHRSRFACRSILAVPMLNHQSRVSGVVEFHNRRGPSSARGVNLPTSVKSRRARRGRVPL